MLISESKLLDRKLLRRGHTYDVSLLWMIVLMAAFSLMMVYSASIAYAGHDGGSKYYYLSRQAVFLAAGGLFAWLAAKMPLSAMAEPRYTAITSRLISAMAISKVALAYCG